MPITINDCANCRVTPRGYVNEVATPMLVIQCSVCLMVRVTHWQLDGAVAEWNAANPRREDADND